MKAAVLHGPHDLRLESVPDPRPAPDEAVVRIARNGICGSDIHFYEAGRLGPFVVDRPYIPGHEACGVVVEAAHDGRGPRKGERVAVEPGVPCRRCHLCKTGRYNLCEDVVFLSAPPVNGTLAEYAAVAGDFLHPLPEAVDDEHGAFVEPVSVAVHAATRGRLSAGVSVAVVGCGPIGLLTVLVARAFGATRIFGVDVLPNRLQMAGRLGADHPLDARAGDAAERLRALTGGRGADVVFDCSGSSKACADAPLLAARGGRVVLIGWPETSRFAWPVELVIERELEVLGVNRYCNVYPRAISLLATRRIDTQPLVTHRYPFAEVGSAFRTALSDRASVIKIMIDAAGGDSA